MLTVTANTNEPVLNTATLVISLADTTRTLLLKTNGPSSSTVANPAPTSLLYIDTEVTDVHNQSLEAKVSSLASIGSQESSNKFNTTTTNIIYIDTEITDVHSQALEAKVSNIPNLSGKFYVVRLDTTIAGYVAAPTFAYSSGEDVKVAPAAVQTWYI